VQMAAIRAKQLKQGANALVSADENKAVVIALREIAAGRILPDYPPEVDAGGEGSGSTGGGASA